MHFLNPVWVYVRGCVFSGLLKAQSRVLLPAGTE